MKTLFLISSLFLVSGCYTQVQVSYPYDYYTDSRSNNQEINSDSVDDEYATYEDGYDEGYYEGARVFTDSRVANRWSPYYNRFYWADSYWSDPFYDRFLWDPFYGAYGYWGASYYYGNYGGSYFSAYPFYTWNRGGGYRYGNNVIFVGASSGYGDHGNSRWIYGPRESGSSQSVGVRPRTTGVGGVGNSGLVNPGTARKSISTGSRPRTSGGSATPMPKRKSSTNTKPAAPARPTRSTDKPKDNTYRPSSNSNSNKPSSSTSSPNTSPSSSSSSSSKPASAPARPSRTGNN